MRRFFKRASPGLAQAFDDVQFGPSRTLNLRSSLPTAAVAAVRVEKWLRQHQVSGSGSVLVITGRGKSSVDGIPVVKEACVRVFHELRRKGVIAEFGEHTAGSFVVELAPVSAKLEAGKGRREPPPRPLAASPPTLGALHDETRQALRDLAERSLEALGVRSTEPFLESEMLRLFGVLSQSVREGPDQERRLREAINIAMSEYD